MSEDTTHPHRVHALLEDVPTAALPELIRYVLSRAEAVGLTPDCPPRVTVALTFDGIGARSDDTLANLGNALYFEGVNFSPLLQLGDESAADYFKRA